MVQEKILYLTLTVTKPECVNDWGNIWKALHLFIVFSSLCHHLLPLQLLFWLCCYKTVLPGMLWLICKKKKYKQQGAATCWDNVLNGQINPFTEFHLKLCTPLENQLRPFCAVSTPLSFKWVQIFYDLKTCPARVFSSISQNLRQKENIQCLCVDCFPGGSLSKGKTSFFSKISQRRVACWE